MSEDEEVPFLEISLTKRERSYASMTDYFSPTESWSDRKLRELKALGQSTEKPYVFLTSCVDARGEDISELLENYEECTYDEVAFNCDLTKFAKTLGYDDSGLVLAEDWHVTYNRGLYRGCPCYVLTHSAIEYIWVNARAWKPKRMHDVPG